MIFVPPCGSCKFREMLEASKFGEVGIFGQQVPANDPWALVGVKRFEKQQFESRRFYPVDVLRKASDQGDAGIFYKTRDRSRFSQRAACAEMDYPIRETARHHFRKFFEGDAVTVKVYLSRRTVKRKVQYAVISLAQKFKVVSQPSDLQHARRAAIQP